MTPKRGSISKKENKSPIKASRKSSMKLQKDEKKHAESKDMRIEMENVVSDIDKRRKSSRKSVAFDRNVSRNLLHIYIYTICYRITLHNNSNNNV